MAGADVYFNGRWIAKGTVTTDGESVLIVGDLAHVPSGQAVMTKLRILTMVEVDMPEGATHYSGDLLSDDHSWFKRARNETGTFDGWVMFKRGEWYLESWLPETPHWVKPIRARQTVTMVDGK